MSITIKIRAGSAKPDPPKPEPVPEGYEIRTVLKWGVNYNPDGSPNMVMITEAGCSTEQQHEVGSFQVIPLLIVNSITQEWVRDWSAVSQTVKITHPDMMKIANVNLLPFGYKWGMTDAQIIAARDVPLADGSTVNKKLKWLYNNLLQGNPDPYAPMWGKGEWWQEEYKDASGATQPFSAKYGCMAWGGRKLAVSKTTKDFFITFPAEKPTAGRHWEKFKRIYPFTRDKFGTRIEWLMPTATVANHPGSTFGEYPRGFIYSPGVFYKPGYDYYISVDWLEAVSG